MEHKTSVTQTISRSYLLRNRNTTVTQTIRHTPQHKHICHTKDPPILFKSTLLYNYPSMADYQSNCPNAENLIKEVLSLPVHPALSDSDVFEVISSIKSFFE